MTRHDRSSGFTLLEVLVALAILAASYGILMEIFGSVARTTDVTADYRNALLIAESRFAQISVNTQRVEPTKSGVIDDRYHWQLTYAPDQQNDQADMETPYAPELITLTISWTDDRQRSRSIQLDTIRLVSRQKTW